MHLAQAGAFGLEKLIDPTTVCVECCGVTTMSMDTTTVGGASQRPRRVIPKSRRNTLDLRSKFALELRTTQWHDTHLGDKILKICETEEDSRDLGLCYVVRGHVPRMKC
eukprot:1319656-Amphidinium_carterae.1